MRVGEAAPPPHQGDNKSSFQAAEERGSTTARQRVTARLTALTSQVNSVTSTSPRGRTILISLGEHAAYKINSIPVSSVVDPEWFFTGSGSHLLSHGRIQIWTSASDPKARQLYKTVFVF
jgi:hypothetical protein